MAPKSGPKSLSTAANLANLLPTGTVLAFQALLPSFSNNGLCLPSHKYLTLCSIVVCSFACFLSSFTDSFIGNNGKLYYGIATVNGLYIFNKGDEDDSDDDDVGDNKDDHKDVNNNDEQKAKSCFGFWCFQRKCKKDDNIVQGVNLEKYSISLIDFVHAFSSLLVFLVFATSSSDVQSCFFSKSGDNANVLMINLPLGVGTLSSLLFMLFPTKRRGIGYADMGRRPTTKEEKGSNKSKQEDNITNGNVV